MGNKEAKLAAGERQPAILYSTGRGDSGQLGLNNPEDVRLSSSLLISSFHLLNSSNVGR